MKTKFFAKNDYQFENIEMLEVIDNFVIDVKNKTSCRLKNSIYFFCHWLKPFNIIIWLNFRAFNTITSLVSIGRRG